MSTVHASELELLRLHIDALFAHDAAGRIWRTNEPGGRRAPRFYLGRCHEGNIWRFRDDLAEDIVEALAMLVSSEPVVDDLRSEPRALAAFQRVLGDDPERRPSSVPAYRFPDELPDAPGVSR